MLLKNLGQILINVSVLTFYLSHYAYLRIIETNNTKVTLKKSQSSKDTRYIEYEQWGDNYPIY